MLSLKPPSILFNYVNLRVFMLARTAESKVGHDENMDAKIYHNPRCSKSRQALATLRDAGIEPEIIKYLDTPPSKEELSSLIDAAGLHVIDAVRTKEAEFKELGLSKDSTDEELLDAMVTHPRLIERPFVITNKGVRMARPTEKINEIL